MCIFKHKYKVVGVEHGTAENLIGNTIEATLIKKVCSKCKKPKTEWVKGNFNLEDFKE